MWPNGTTSLVEDALADAWSLIFSETNDEETMALSKERGHNSSLQHDEPETLFDREARKGNPERHKRGTSISKDEKMKSTKRAKFSYQEVAEYLKGAGSVSVVTPENPTPIPNTITIVTERPTVFKTRFMADEHNMIEESMSSLKLVVDDTTNSSSRNVMLWSDSNRGSKPNKARAQNECRNPRNAYPRTGNSNKSKGKQYQARVTKNRGRLSCHSRTTSHATARPKDGDPRRIRHGRHSSSTSSRYDHNYATDSRCPSYYACHYRLNESVRDTSSFNRDGAVSCSEASSKIS